MIEWLKRNRETALHLGIWLSASVIGQLLILQCASPFYKIEVWYVFGFNCFLLLLGALIICNEIDHLQYAEDLINEQIDFANDQIKLIDQLNEVLKCDLDGEAMDKTVLGAFIVGRQACYTRDVAAVASQLDFDDHEFDGLFLVKRKSTPVEDVLREMNEIRKF
jgi:hypothetical protein